MTNGLGNVPNVRVTKTTRDNGFHIMPLRKDQAAPIKCDGRESAGLLALAVREFVGLPAVVTFSTSTFYRSGLCHSKGSDRLI